ncbi:MAG: deoxyribodipyrimidine photo-lyase [Nitratireductor sp.]|nr:deoxyribodipyrimidine photo-lyase [Nitratireductor sp.]
MTSPVIVWLRTDLRITDNPALHHAAATGAPVIPLYIHDVSSKGIRPPGAAQNWFLHHALEGLKTRLAKLGAPLIVASGQSADVLDRVLAQTGAKSVFWNRRYVPAETGIDRAIKQDLSGRGIEAKSYQAGLLHEPTRLLTGSGQPYRVFTPFWKALMRDEAPRGPMPAPRHLAAWSGKLDSEELAALGLLPKRPDWAGGLRQTWKPDEEGAADLLGEFLDVGLSGYADGRDYPGKAHVSHLSPYLRWGIVSPNQLWHAIRHADAHERDKEKFLQELGWREFCHHQLFHYPELPRKNFNPRFEAFEWIENSSHVYAWRKGQTGYPVVDAGMRELWRTGTMHNRVRMVVASFLVKHLLVHWRVGEAWFWDTLVDGDPASNPANWQWVAGSGADAAPYFRVFNPVLQGEKFDPDGTYVRRFVPEIAALPERYLHAPWQAPADVLRQCGVKLGETYPAPVVDHAHARKRALVAFSKLKEDG